MNYNILIVGVGGQGTLLASRVLGKFAEINGLDCKLSEVHGMAQRGGSVVTHVKIAEKVFSPLVEEGKADILIAFEELEAARWAHYIKKDAYIVVNKQQIMPMPVVSGMAVYPKGVIESLKGVTKNIIAFDALSVAEKSGNKRTMNTVMLAQLAKNLKLDYDKMKKALTESVPQKTIEANIKAFDEGYNS